MKVCVGAIVSNVETVTEIQFQVLLERNYPCGKELSMSNQSRKWDPSKWGVCDSSPWNSEVSLVPEKKPVNRVAFYHPRGFFFDTCIYTCGRWYFLSLVWCFFSSLLKFFLELLNMFVCVLTFMWESVCWGRMVIK